MPRKRVGRAGARKRGGRISSLMKRYGDLYNQISSLENVYIAHEKAQKRKRHYAEIKRINRSLPAYMKHLHKMLTAQKYQTSKYQVQTRNDTGKEREIYVLPYYPDRIVHHCIMNVCEPIWQKTLIRDTFSAIKGRGIHDGQRRIRKFLADRQQTKYCLKMDVKKFYPSIDHDVLKRILRQKIKCRKTLALLDEIVGSAPGLPIGNYLSQYLGNLYLSPFDHWVKEKLGVKYYARYCDDMVVFGGRKSFLHDIRRMVDRYLKEHLCLQVKENWQVFPVAVRGVDFLGYRFFHDYTLVRKSIAKKFKARMRGIRKSPGKTALNQVMSYYGWFRYADAKRLWSVHVDRQVRSSVDRICRRNRQKNALDRAA